MSEVNINKIYKKIKEHRGERFARKLRDADLLDIPNIEHILEFANFEDLDDLIPVIRSEYKIISVSKNKTNKDPIQLLNEAGYDAFVVKTEKQKNSIKKYFRPDEQLCTFSDSYRHKEFYIIHAVKRGADKIKPSDNPKREDEYGTSVISIQIAKSGGFISIKNRYNHTVSDPDSTFNNNPDNIILGLTNSLQKYFDVDFSVSDVEMPENYVNVDNQLVYCNFERNGIWFGPKYYIKNGEIVRLSTDRETMIDHMIYNDKTKKITTPLGDNDKTCTFFAKLFNGKQITKTIDKATNNITLQTQNGDRIITDDKGQIIELDLPNVTKIPDNFLDYNTTLKSINLPKVKVIGDDFLSRNTTLKSINLPNVKTIGDDFLWFNKMLETINLPKVETIGNYCLDSNKKLKSINLPNVKLIRNNFLRTNNELELINLPKVKVIDDNFLRFNEELKSINLPKLEFVGDCFLWYNERLESINLPNVKHIGWGFMVQNTVLKTIYLSNSVAHDRYFLPFNNKYNILDPQQGKFKTIKKATKQLNNAIELNKKIKNKDKSLSQSKLNGR